MKVRCDIEGLDCPHCASKLESLLKKDFIEANLNYATKSLVLDVEDNTDEDEAVEKANKIAIDFEEGIYISLRDQIKKRVYHCKLWQMVLTIRECKISS